MPYFFYLILSLYGIRTFILILSPSMNEGLKKKTRVVVETEGKEERRREMGVQSLFINAWIREAQEASRLVENLEIKIENNPQQALGDTARSNLFDLGIKLDRLESLLHNPPSKPILTDRDLDFRWKMLSNIQLRTRMVFQSLYALPSKERSGNLATGDAKETSATDIGYYQDHTKVTFSQEDLELLMPLIVSCHS
ncbi:unnamed protein product, partial [Vitis vinifera]